MFPSSCQTTDIIKTGIYILFGMTSANNVLQNKKQIFSSNSTIFSKKNYEKQEKFSKIFDIIMLKHKLNKKSYDFYSHDKQQIHLDFLSLYLKIIRT